MLVAVQRISCQNYDAILVDWDQEVDAKSLLKTVREQKVASQALSLAVVKNEKDLPRALQHGANSVIRKPIDPWQAKETLSTARDLILSRRSEQKTKEERTAAAQAAMAGATAELQDEVEPPAPKRGFVAQTAPRTAMEAVESTENQTSRQPSQRQTAQVPGKRHEPELQPHELQPVNNARWDQKPQPLERPSFEIPPREGQPSDDSTGVFSSLPEEELQPEPEKHSHPRYLVFAVVGCLLIAAALWAWAPGDSYQSLLGTLLHSLSRAPHPAAPQSGSAGSPVRSVSLEQPTPPSPPAPSAPEEQPGPTDPGPVESSEVDPSQLEVIETKAIPKPGAQKPAQTETPAGSDQEPAQTPAMPTEVSAPAVQPSPQIQPTIAPVIKPQIPVAVPFQEKPVPTPTGRTGVIIPDSLRTTPSQSPANSLDSGLLPEETSRNLVEHRVEPDYPAQALPQHLAGPVVLQVWVAKDGTVRDVKLVRGYFALARAASDAVRQWRFKPYSSNGKPIDFQTIVTVNFKYPG